MVEQKKNKNRLWIFSELFFPEETSTAYIMTEISKKLSEKYDVNIVTTNPSYDNIESEMDNREIFNTLRVKSFKGNKNNNISRIFKFFYLSFCFLFILLFKVKKGEKVFTVTNPAPFLVLAAVAKLFKKIELSILVHDVFPENTLSAGYVKSELNIFYKLVKTLFDWSYSKYDNIIVLGRDMRDLFHNKLKSYKTETEIKIIENWADIDNIRAHYKIVHNEKIVFQFAGNLGAIQGLDFLIDIVKNVKNSDLEFHFYGTGKMKSYLEDVKRVNNLNNVHFFPSFKRDEQNIILNNSSFGIVTLSKGMEGLGVPSKTYNILAAGKPILYIGDPKSEISLLVKEHNIGYVFNHDEKDKLLNFFNHFSLNENSESILLKSKNARMLSEKFYSRNMILNKFLEII